MIKLFKIDGTISKSQVWNLLGITAGMAVFVLPDAQQWLTVALQDHPGMSGLVIAAIKGIDYLFRAITTQAVR